MTFTEAYYFYIPIIQSDSINNWSIFPYYLYPPRPVYSYYVRPRTSSHQQYAAVRQDENQANSTASSAVNNSTSSTVLSDSNSLNQTQTNSSTPLILAPPESNNSSLNASTQSNSTSPAAPVLPDSEAIKGLNCSSFYYVTIGHGRHHNADHKASGPCIYAILPDPHPPVVVPYDGPDVTSVPPAATNSSNTTFPSTADIGLNATQANSTTPLTSSANATNSTTPGTVGVTDSGVNQLNVTQLTNSTDAVNITQPRRILSANEPIPTEPATMSPSILLKLFKDLIESSL